MSLYPHRFFLIALILLIPLSVIAQSSPKQIVIGLVPEINIFKQMDRYTALAEYLTKKTGIKIKLTIFNRYGKIVDNFNAQKMDGAFLGTFTAILAYEKLAIEALVRPITLDGSSTYHGHIFVRKESGIKNVNDMKGKTMAFIDQANACGYIFPLAYLKENGVDNIDSFFSEYYFAGSHDAVIQDVLEKKVDVGVVKNTVYDIVIKNNPNIDKELVILADSPEFPTTGLFLRKSLDSNLKNRLKKALLLLNKDANGKRILKDLGAKQFIETKMPADYVSVYELTKKAGINLQTYDYTPYAKDRF